MKRTINLGSSGERVVAAAASLDISVSDYVRRACDEKFLSLLQAGVPMVLPRGRSSAPTGGDNVETTELEVPKDILSPPKGGELYPLKWPTRDGKRVWELGKELYLKLVDTHLGVDVPYELRKAHFWLSQDDKRLKTIRGMPTFLSNWLGRSAPSQGHGDPAPAPYFNRLTLQTGTKD
jgi:hypothetical protein